MKIMSKQNPTFEPDWPMCSFFHEQLSLSNRGSVNVHLSASPSTPRVKTIPHASP
jgi:hypothetical protein